MQFSNFVLSSSLGLIVRLTTVTARAQVQVPKKAWVLLSVPSQGAMVSHPLGVAIIKQKTSLATYGQRNQNFEIEGAQKISLSFHQVQLPNKTWLRLSVPSQEAMVSHPLGVPIIKWKTSLATYGQSNQNFEIEGLKKSACPPTTILKSQEIGEQWQVEGHFYIHPVTHQ